MSLKLQNTPRHSNNDKSSVSRMIEPPSTKRSAQTKYFKSTLRDKSPAFEPQKMPPESTRKDRHQFKDNYNKEEK
jgi:hypothetical protein